MVGATFLTNYLKNKSLKKRSPGNLLRKSGHLCSLSKTIHLSHNARSRSVWLLLFTSILAVLLLLIPLQVKAETYQEIIHDIGTSGRISPQVVLDRLEWADSIPDERSPLEERATYYMWLGKFAALSRQFEKAEQAVNRLKNLETEYSCASCKGGRLIVQGYIAARQNNIPEVEVALSQMNPSDDEQMLRLQFLELQAYLYHAKSEIPKIIEVSLQAAELSEELNRPSDQVRALSYIVLANIHRRDLDRAMVLAEEAYEKAKALNDVEQMVNTRGNQGWIYALQGDFEKQADCLRDTIAITDQYPELELQAMTNRINLAENLIAQEMYEEAIEVADEAIERADKLNHTIARAVAMHGRAVGIASTVNKEQGIEELKQAIQLAESESAKSYALDMYRSLAELHERFADYESAAEAYKKIIELESEIIKSEREEEVQAAQEKYETEKKNREIERLSLEKVADDAEILAKETRQKLWIALAFVFLLIALMLVQWLRTSRKRNLGLMSDNVELSKQTNRDPLTKAYNRRFLQRKLQEMDENLKHLSRQGRSEDILGIILLDVDFFKDINDTYGHAVGDAVLIEMTKRFRKLLRERDMVVRWGGEEFVLLLPNINGALCKVAERVINTIGKKSFDYEGQQLRITISAGCFTWPAFKEQSWEEAIHLADMAAYASKSGGRNRATCIMSIDPEADKKELAKDLTAAEEKNWVELKTIEGPETP